MANRRMFSLAVTDTDQFLDLPPAAQALYFHLGMHADDDGFIASPKKIARAAGCGEDELALLVERGLILRFESGVVTVRDWRINNTLRNDRYRETLYTREKRELHLDENGRYLYGPAEEDALRPEEAAPVHAAQPDDAPAEPDGKPDGAPADPDGKPDGEPDGSRMLPAPEPEPNGTEPNQTEPNRTEPNRTEQKRESTCAAKPPRAYVFPPGIGEVEAYCLESGIRIDVRRFLDYYASNGWRVGKNPMKDWKAAVRNWERGDNNGFAGHNSTDAGAAAKRFDELGLYDVS